MPTGEPRFFRCAKCKAANVPVTGKKKENCRTGAGYYRTKYEYCCSACGHVGWGTHPDLAAKFDKLTKKGSA